MMIPLLLSIWSWDACPDPATLTYRVESVRRYVVATVDGRDDNGALISLPLYNVWAPTFIKEGPETQAEDGCEPGVGEACVIVVTAIDGAGNLDDGRECS